MFARGLCRIMTTEELSVMSDMNDLDRQRLEQLRKYAEWDRVNRQGQVGKLHVLDWAATEIETLRAKVAELEAGDCKKRLDEAPGLCDWLYRAGYVTAQKERDYDPRGHQAWQACYDELTTPQPAKLPEGYALLPLEPSEAILMAMVHGMELHGDESTEALSKTYKAMLSAQND